MANENQINSNSNEYDKGYSRGHKEGLYSGLSIGCIITTLAISGAWYVNNQFKKSNNQVSTSNLEKTLEVAKADKEDFDTRVARLNFENNPDEETTKAIATECYKSYGEIKHCFVPYTEEENKCIKDAYKSPPKEEAGFKSCMKRSKGDWEGERDCMRKYPITEEMEIASNKCQEQHNNAFHYCIAPYINYEKKCKKHKLEQGFKRYQEQKNPQRRN